MLRVLLFIQIFTFGLISQVESSPTHKHQQSLIELWHSLNPQKAKQSGQKLMALPYGIHQLSPANKRGPLVILVHGYKSRGYEWVYAAKQLYARGEVYFYRWNWDQCPQEGAAGLHQALTDLRQRMPQRKVEVLGHSYGGVISAVLATKARLGSAINTHIIAAPLAGYKRLEESCQPSIKQLLAPIADRPAKTRPKVIQWKTIHHLDGAFKHLKDDPQQVTWPDLIHLLPETYKGHRLGHNWSISAVVDQILTVSK